MQEQSSVVEIWTVSRRGLVLSGPPEQIGAIAGRLHLPCDAAECLTPSRAELVLWGDSLELYARDRATASPQSPTTPDDR